MGYIIGKYLLSLISFFFCCPYLRKYIKNIAKTNVKGLTAYDIRSYIEVLIHSEFIFACIYPIPFIEEDVFSPLYIPSNIID